MTTYLSSTPTRIDIAGGTLDLWPIHQVLKNSATVHFGIDLCAEISVQHLNTKEFILESHDQNMMWKGSWESLDQASLPLHSLAIQNIWSESMGGLHIRSHAKSPAGAGLGGSSSLLVCLAKTLLLLKNNLNQSTKEYSEHELVRLAGDIEAKLIHAPTGCQDYWGALRGGVNVIRFPAGGEFVTTHSGEIVNELNEKLIVCYSGQSRQSAINNWEIFKGVFNKDQKILADLEVIGELASECANAIENKNIDLALRTSKIEWTKRVELWPSIHTENTRRIEAAAMNAGADFSRVCGAGGGGVMAIFVDPPHRAKVKAACINVGGTILDSKIQMRGFHSELR